MIICKAHALGFMQEFTGGPGTLIISDNYKRVTSTVLCSNRSHVFCQGTLSELCLIAELIAGPITDLNAIRAIFRSYIGNIWATHKLYVSHVQPTVQATDGP